MDTQKCIQIKDKQIPIIIRNYKYSKYVKFYFRSNVLNISKPKRLSMKKLNEFIEKNKDYIYEEYLKIISIESDFIKHWVTGEKIFFKGEEFKIVINIYKLKRITILINEEEKKFQINIPEELNELEENVRKQYIDKSVKKILKKETEKIISDRILYWSEVTKIKYNSFKVADAISKYGSCIPKTRNLHFSSRLAMLPIKQIDSVIVHELCHIVYSDHSDNFYKLVKKYMPDYDERNKWLKKNNKILAI